MKYNIEGFSQKRLIELGLDCIDAHLLRWFIDFQNTEKMKTIIHEEKTWYWVSYSGVLKDLPILNIERRTVQRRFLKLVKAGILFRYTYKVGGSFSCFAIREGGTYTSLIEYSKEEEKQSGSTIGFENPTPKDSRMLPKNSSAIHPSAISNNDISLKYDLSCVHFIEIYCELYEKHEGKEHPNIKEEQAIKALEVISASTISEYDDEAQRLMIQDYLLTVKGDHNINHFISGDIIDLRIERYKNNLCFKDVSLYFQVKCYRDTGRFDEIYLDFLELYANKYRQYTGENHPAMKLSKLDDYAISIGAWDLLYSDYMDDILDDFFTTAKKSNHRLGYFASEGVLEITNYRAM
jgi:DNA-binding Lrp family transcriptional regulator